MRAPKPDELGKNLEGFGLEVVFDGFDLLFHSIGTQAKEIEHFRESLVAHFDMVGHGAALGGKRETAIFLVIHKAAPGEAAHHVGHR